MGVQVISIPTEVVSHSLPFPFPIMCFIPIPIGFPWDSRSHWEFHSHAHFYYSVYRCMTLNPDFKVTLHYVDGEYLMNGTRQRRSTRNTGGDLRPTEACNFKRP